MQLSEPPPPELEDDELLLEDELLDELELDELELDEDELLLEELELLLDDELPPTTPYGAGCDSQVLREIQL